MPRKGQSTHGGIGRREMVSAIVDNQISRGVVKPEEKDLQISYRMKNATYSDTKRTYMNILGGKK